MQLYLNTLFVHPLSHRQVLQDVSLASISVPDIRKDTRLQSELVVTVDVWEVVQVEFYGVTNHGGGRPDGPLHVGVEHRDQLFPSEVHLGGVQRFPVKGIHHGFEPEESGDAGLRVRTAGAFAGELQYEVDQHVVVVGARG